MFGNPSVVRLVCVLLFVIAFGGLFAVTAAQSARQHSDNEDNGQVTTVSEPRTLGLLCPGLVRLVGTGLR